MVVCEARLIGSCLNLTHRWISSISQSNGRMEKPVEDLLIFAFLGVKICLFSITFNYDGESHSSCHLCKWYHHFYIIYFVFVFLLLADELFLEEHSEIMIEILYTGSRPWQVFILQKHLTKNADSWPVRVWDSVLTSGWENIQPDQW